MLTISRKWTVRAVRSAGDSSPAKTPFHVFHSPVAAITAARTNRDSATSRTATTARITT
jgi:hypothetical protein